MLDIVGVSDDDSHRGELRRVGAMLAVMARR